MWLVLVRWCNVCATLGMWKPLLNMHSFSGDWNIYLRLGWTLRAEHKGGTRRCRWHHPAKIRLQRALVRNGKLFIYLFLMTYSNDLIFFAGFSKMCHTSHIFTFSSNGHMPKTFSSWLAYSNAVIILYLDATIAIFALITYTCQTDWCLLLWWFLT